jgi:pSer/pThr/pTyr-binding forkhead associated (FHA) protein
VILGDGTVRTVPLRGDRWTIGRADDCSIVLRDPTVSRRHLQLEWNGTSFQFRDLGGSNPVSIDNKPAHAGEILPGQVITIGLTRLVIERRSAAMTITPDDQRTVVISREVADDEVPPTLQHPQAATAVRVLDRIEWTFADLGDLRDAAEPLLDLSRNLTSRSSGWIGRFTADGSIEALASHSVPGATSAARLPESMLSEACRSTRPYLVRTAEGSTTVDRLLVPLGKVGEGLMVLQQPQPGAPAGQELLRLAQSLGSVVWHRLQETTERLRLRDEVKRLRCCSATACSRRARRCADSSTARSRSGWSAKKAPSAKTWPATCTPRARAGPPCSCRGTRCRCRHGGTNATCSGTAGSPGGCCSGCAAAPCSSTRSND